MMEAGIGARVSHDSFGEGVVYSVSLQAYKILFQSHGEKAIARNYEGLEVISPGEIPKSGSLSIEEVETVLTRILTKYADFTPLVPLGRRWKGGKMILQPKDPNLSSKEIPVETFFHKIVMLRDRLRVLEQNINSHDSLDDEEKVHLQQYVTRCYGSLTTFNVLFEKKDHHFKGEGKK